MRIFLYAAVTVTAISAGVIGMLAERLMATTAEADYLRLRLHSELGLAVLREEQIQIHRTLHETESAYIRALHARLESAALRTYIQRINPRARSETIAESIQACARRYEVEPQLVLGVMQQESSFNHLAVGPVGERGLMQLSPNTARSLEVPWDQAFDIETNVCGGTRYLAGLVARYRDPEKTAHHYNGGGDPLYAMRVSRHLLRIAREFPRREFDPGRAAILAGLARKEAVRHEPGTERF